MLVRLPLGLAGITDSRQDFAALFEREWRASPAGQGERLGDWLHGASPSTEAANETLAALQAAFAARAAGTSVLVVPGLFGDCVDSQSVPFGDGVMRTRDAQHDRGLSAVWRPGPGGHPVDLVAWARDVHPQRAAAGGADPTRGGTPRRRAHRAGGLFQGSARRAACIGPTAGRRRHPRFGDGAGLGSRGRDGHAVRRPLRAPVRDLVAALATAGLLSFGRP